MYPYPPSSVKLVLFDPVVCPHSPSITEIFFLPPTWTFVEPDPSLSLHVKLTPSLAAILITLSPSSANLNVHSFGEARREIVFSVQVELAALPHVKTMTNEVLRTVAQSISHYYNFSFHQPCFSRLHAYADSFLTGMCIHDYSLLSFSISFTLFQRQWQRFFKYPQRFSRGTHGRFLHIFPNVNEDDNDITTAFMYMTEAEILAI